ncbi:hypothetical protein F4818DRAFT_142529 [Hypoxylon cercidicola]|nr:hypothetical protein F4818DRAFT_142529 [Hypoxylon cercidicola]
MENSPQDSSHFALLVGINGYPKPHKPLEGCVRDVHDIRSFLASKLGIFPIELLTETQPDTPDTPIPSNSGEDAEARPTYSNVVSAFGWILSHANPGSFVYIHLSGHGVQKAEFPDDTQPATSKPLALALLSGEQHPNPPVRYLCGTGICSGPIVFMHRHLEKRPCCRIGWQTRSQTPQAADVQFNNETHKCLWSIEGDRHWHAGRPFDDLVDEIRQQPGFEEFLKPLSFEEIQAAAEHGPIVVIKRLLPGLRRAHR